MAAVRAKRRRRKKKGHDRGEATIASLIEKIYPSREPDEQRLVRIAALWQRIAPLRVRQNVRPASFKFGVLTFKALSSAWSQELTYLLPKLMPRLQSHVVGIDPTKIRVRVGALPPVPPEIHPPPIRIAPLRAGEIPEPVAAAIARLGDDDLRDVVLKAAAQSLAHALPTRSS